MYVYVHTHLLACFNAFIILPFLYALPVAIVTDRLIRVYLKHAHMMWFATTVVCE